MNIRFFYLVLAAGLAASAGLAAAPNGLDEELVLEEAIEIGLAHNERLLSARELLAAADAEWSESRSSRRPTVGLSLSGSRSTNPAQVFGQLLGQEAFTESNFDPAFLNEPDPLTNVTSTVSARQVVWSGGRVGSDIAAARARRDSSAASAERTRQNVIRDVTVAYADAVLASARVGVARKARETARGHVALAEERHAAGLVVRSDVLQAQVRQQEIEEELIRAGNEAEVSRAVLNLVLGVEIDRSWSLPADLTAVLDGRDAAPRATVDALVDAARSGRPDLEASGRTVAALASRIDHARSGRYPEVGLLASYELNDDELLGADGSNWTVALSARLDLYDGGRARTRVRGAESRHRAARHGHERMRRSIELEVRRASAELDSALSRVKIAGTATRLAEESLRIVRDRYGEGLSPLVDLLDAETGLTRARTRRVMAQRDVLVALSSLDLATGSL
ncbi:MAG: TolC family protein [Acidobacteriota bacterium]|nr:TolC family protein [Acidobacteriota bacterium]